MSAPNSAFRTAHLEQKHVNAYNQLSSSAKTVATLQSALGDADVNTTQRKLSLLIDEGLAVQVRSPNNPNGKPTGTFQLA